MTMVAQRAERHASVRCWSQSVRGVRRAQPAPRVSGRRVHHRRDWSLAAAAAQKGARPAVAVVLRRKSTLQRQCCCHYHQCLVLPDGPASST